MIPLLTLSLRVGGPLASQAVRAEAASLLQLLRDVSIKYGRRARLLIFIDCQVLLDILRKWGTHNVHPRPKEVVHFDVIYPLLLELRQWLGDLVLMKIKSTIPLFSSGNVIFFQRRIPHLIGGLKCPKMELGLKRD